jgi:hypothetical protein
VPRIGIVRQLHPAWSASNSLLVLLAILLAWPRASMHIVGTRSSLVEEPTRSASEAHKVGLICFTELEDAKRSHRVAGRLKHRILHFGDALARVAWDRFQARRSPNNIFSAAQLPSEVATHQFSTFDPEAVPFVPSDSFGDGVGASNKWSVLLI